MTRTEVGLLGTTCTVTIYKGWSQTAFDEVFARIAQIEERMTVNREDSEVIRVNRAAGKAPVPVSPDTLLRDREGARDLPPGRRGLRHHRGTAGEAVGHRHRLGEGPLAGGDQRRAAAGRLARRGALAAAGNRVSPAARHGPRPRCHRQGLRRRRGAGSCGPQGRERRAHRPRRQRPHVGAKPDGSPWRIGVQNPEEPRGTHIGIVEVGETAVVTSGTYERFFEPAAGATTTSSTRPPASPWPTAWRPS